MAAGARYSIKLRRVRTESNREKWHGWCTLWKLASHASLKVFERHACSANKRTMGTGLLSREKTVDPSGSSLISNQYDFVQRPGNRVSKVISTERSDNETVAQITKRKKLWRKRSSVLMPGRTSAFMSQRGVSAQTAPIAAIFGAGLRGAGPRIPISLGHNP